MIFLLTARRESLLVDMDVEKTAVTHMSSIQLTTVRTRCLVPALIPVLRCAMKGVSAPP